MSIPLKFKGIVHRKTNERTTKGGNKVQTIYITKPEIRDTFDEIKVPAKTYEIQVWNNKTEQLTPLNRGDKVEFSGWLNSKENLHGNQISYSLHLTVRKIEKIQ